MPLPRDPFRQVRPPDYDPDPYNEELQEARRGLLAVVEKALTLAARTDSHSVAVGWTHGSYAKMVAAGHKIVGFPETMVFAHPSEVGAISKLKELTAKWESGEIHFANATELDRRRAQHSPHKVFPGRRVVAASRKPYCDFDTLPSSNISRRLEPRPDSPCPKELVLHPTSLIPFFEQSIGAMPHPDALPRMQRMDTKKARTRAVHGGRRGLTTLPFVVVSPTKRRGQPPSKRAKAVPTYDRIDKYYAPEGREDESDPIEDAWDAVGTGLESDPIEEWVEEGSGRKRKASA